MKVRVRAKELCIINASRVRPGTEFDYELGEGKSLPKYLELASEPDSRPKPGDEVVIAGKKARIPKNLHDYDLLRGNNK